MTEPAGSWLSATAMAWDLAGRPRRDPPPPGPAPGACAVCGSRAQQTVPARATVGNKTFTDQYLLADAHSGCTCVPCAWAMAGRPPHAIRLWTVAAAPGRDLGPSHPASQAAVAGEHPGLLLTARNDMRPVAGLLCDPPDGPWAVAAAESGQKHTLPYTAVNRGAGRWRVRMDAVTVTSDPAEFAVLLGRCAVLRKDGFTAAEVTAVSPPAGKLTAARLPVWLEHAGHLMQYRGSPVLKLANFMICKEHYDHYTATFVTS